DRADLLQLLLSLTRGRAGAGGSPAARARAVGCAAVAGDEPDRSRSGAYLSGRRKRSAARELSGTFAADRLLYPGAFLRARCADVPGACPEVAPRDRIDGRQTLMSLRLRLIALSAAALLAVPAAADDLIVRAPAGAVKGQVKGGVHVFRGVPYAQPPVGDARWKPPV